MRIEPIEWQTGMVDIRALASFEAAGETVIQAGIASFPKGVRHPATGLSAHKGTEVSLIIDGSFEVETADGISRVDGNNLVVIPAGEGHATTALADSRVFYILFGPRAE
jgi:quercetin dioxygenase-like cupin family protein